MPSVMEVPSALPAAQWSALSSSLRPSVRPHSVSVHGHEALLPTAYSVASDTPMPKALEISVTKSHTYQRTRKRVCYVAIAAIVLAIIIAIAVCVPMYIVATFKPATDLSVLPATELLPSKPPSVEIRIQNANSNWAWMDDLVDAFNLAYDTTNGTIRCRQLPL